MTRLRRSDAVFLFVAVVGIPLGVWLNPYLLTRDDQEFAILRIAAILSVSLVAWEIFQSLRRFPEEHPTEPLGRSAYKALVAFAVVMFFSAWVYRFPWLQLSHHWFADDYTYLEQSADWETTKRNLFVPFNEHVVPLTRLVTVGIVSLGEAPADGQTALAARIFSSLLFLATTALLFQLARRVGRGDLPALVASSWFALSVCHFEAVLYYSASQWMIAACLLLGSLLLVERDCKTRLFWASAFAAFGPWCYSIGALIGPFTSFWLVAWHRRWRWRSIAPAIAGVVSTASVLVVIRLAMQDEKYWTSGGRGLLEAFSPWDGFLYSARLFVDQLILASLGVAKWPVGATEVAFVLVIVAIAVVVGLRNRPSLARLWPIAALVVAGYAIVIPFRTWQIYATLAHNWTRYQLIPHLGMSLLLAGIVGSSTRFQGRLGWTGFGAFLFCLFWWAVWQYRVWSIYHYGI
jgi:hypothetical protein